MASLENKDTGRIEILLEDGMSKAMAQAPIVVSASRSTDIPAFYSDWFSHRMEVGYSAWANPFNGARSYVSYAGTRFIMFWSENSRPLLAHLDEPEERGIGCYIQYSSNGHEKEGSERGMPPIAERIKTFKLSVERLGLGGVVWRFDSPMLTDDIDIDKLLTKIEYIGDQLKGYTEKLVLSFVDIALYRKVKSNLLANGVPYHEWAEEQMVEFCERLVALNKLKGWNHTLTTCGEKGRRKGVEPSYYVDDVLIIRGACDDKGLMEFLKAEIKPIPVPDLFGTAVSSPSDAIMFDNGHYAIRGDNCGRGQHESCGCMKSKGIGQYNTCVHLCECCYANSGKQSAARNYKCHKENPWGETITGV